jgi:excisionase family DNA binding protein
MVKIRPIYQRYLRAAQAAEYTGLSVATIRAYVQQKAIPFIKKGGCVLFDTFELDAWLQSSQVVRINAENEEVSH